MEDDRKPQVCVQRDLERGDSHPPDRISQTALGCGRLSLRSQADSVDKSARVRQQSRGVPLPLRPPNGSGRLQRVLSSPPGTQWTQVVGDMLGFRCCFNGAVFGICSSAHFVFTLQWMPFCASVPLGENNRFCLPWQMGEVLLSLLLALSLSLFLSLSLPPLRSPLSLSFPHTHTHTRAHKVSLSHKNTHNV